MDTNFYFEEDRKHWNILKQLSSNETFKKIKNDQKKSFMSAGMGLHPQAIVQSLAQCSVWEVWPGQECGGGFRRAVAQSISQVCSMAKANLDSCYCYCYC